MMRHVFIKKRNGTLDVTWHDTPEKLHPLFFLLGRGEIKSHLFTKAKANTTRPLGSVFHIRASATSDTLSRFAGHRLRLVYRS